MPVSVNLYNHTRLRFVNGANAAADTYKINLYSAFTFDATATTKAGAESGATQLSTANGYTQNDKTLTGVVFVIANTNGAAFDFDDVQWTASGGSIAASHALVYNDTDADDPPVAHVEFDGTITATAGIPFIFRPDPAGFIIFYAPA
jgi:hypothetical protein